MYCHMDNDYGSVNWNNYSGKFNFKYTYPLVLPLGVYTRETPVWTPRYIHLKVYSSTMHDSDKLETIQCQSVEEWINNELLFSNENTQLRLYPALNEFQCTICI